jgi:hypothetical protein
MNIDHTAFTGTRRGMTDAQQRTLRFVLTGLVMPDDSYWLHHGDDRGADRQCHKIARELGFMIELHPSTITATRGFAVGGARSRPPKEPLIRNHDIVAASARLIAAPCDDHEIERSGTWATARRARILRRPITFLWPDGSMTQEG